MDRQRPSSKGKAPRKPPTEEQVQKLAEQAARAELQAKQKRARADASEKKALEEMKKREGYVLTGNVIHIITILLVEILFNNFAQYLDEVFPQGGAGNTNKTHVEELFNRFRPWILLVSTNQAMRAAVLQCYKKWVQKHRDMYFRAVEEYDRKVANYRSGHYQVPTAADILQKCGAVPFAMHPTQRLFEHVRRYGVLASNLPNFESRMIKKLRDFGAGPKDATAIKDEERTEKCFLKMYHPLSFVGIALNRTCDMCKRSCKSRPLWGTWGQLVCNTCLAQCAIEISTLATRYGVQNLREMPEFQEGKIRVALIENYKRETLLTIDPSASMLSRPRNMYLVDVRSLASALGLEKLKPMMERATALREFGQSVLFYWRAYSQREKYENFRAFNEVKFGTVEDVFQPVKMPQTVERKFFQKVCYQPVEPDRKSGDLNRFRYDCTQEAYVPGLDGIQEEGDEMDQS